MTPLELLADSNDCFISDLRYRPAAELDFGPMLANAECEDLEEWQGVLDYIFPNAPTLQTVEEMKAHIRQCVEENQL